MENPRVFLGRIVVFGPDNLTEKIIADLDAIGVDAELLNADEYMGAILICDDDESMFYTKSMREEIQERYLIKEIKSEMPFGSRKKVSKKQRRRL